jgi:hypothetical protein
MADTHRRTADNVRARQRGRVVVVTVDGPLPPVMRMLAAALNVSSDGPITVDLSDAWLEASALAALAHFGNWPSPVAFIVPEDLLEVADLTTMNAARSGLLRLFFSEPEEAREWHAWNLCRHALLHGSAVGLPTGPVRRRAGRARKASGS